jgi:hypothetical protein
VLYALPRATESASLYSDSAHDSAPDTSIYSDDAPAIS